MATDSTNDLSYTVPFSDADSISGRTPSEITPELDGLLFVIKLKLSRKKEEEQNEHTTKKRKKTRRTKKREKKVAVVLDDCVYLLCPGEEVPSSVRRVNKKNNKGSKVL